ncbi:MAG: response regulator [Gammaproteobacteria bacterium]|nr:response regulator [Gammaproteobacteria bacterium]NIR96964.1 response regulator [Gammaproteobacteria bacterium]NIT62666.1 response regulator [Gammaproteobacteria bacterium]NIV19626.1 response regulator [Gammaproteobacteria bacterium]NIX10846.1 response regulator [Gammaproteobacteria bacterium]
MTNTCILVVDGDERASASPNQGLVEVGYRITVAESASTARALCQNAPPDLVLLSVEIPGGPGMEVANWLRGETAIPFVFVCSHADRNTVRQAAERGALGYLIKPASVLQVIAVVETALVRAQEPRELTQKEIGPNEALARSRTISAAVGIIMERHRVSEKRAFESIQGQAQCRRRSLLDVAREILEGAHMLNQDGDYERSLPP